MKIIHNTGTDRVIDLIRQHLKRGSQLGCVTPTFSLFAFADLIESLSTLEKVQLILPAEDGALDFLGSDGDRAARNRLQTRWLALRCAQWALFGRLAALVVRTQLGFFNAPRLTKCIPLIDQVGDYAAFLSL